jgi:Ca2+-binding RTX toxin-like protein
VLEGNAGQDLLTGGRKGDRFVLDESVNNSSLADVITDFSSAQGDVIQLAKGASRNISFEVFDSDGDGSFDATLMRSADQGIYGIVLSSVNSGISTLTQSNIVL